MNAFRRVPFNFIGSLALYVACGIAAAAERRFEEDWSTAVFWGLFGVVQACWIVGYSLSSLPKWGKWIDGSADIEYKLNIVVGVLFSLVAGNLAYYLGFYEFGWKLLYCICGALAGGFAGEKWLSPLLMRVLPSWPAGSPAPDDSTRKGG